MRTPVLAFLLSAAALGAPRLALAQASGHWETRTTTRELPGRFEARTRNVWQPPRVETEERARAVPGHWTTDIAGNRCWVAPQTIVERVQVCRPGEWKAVSENVWVPGGSVTEEQSVWVADAECAPRGPWDDTPRPARARVSVQPISSGGELPAVRTYEAPAPSSSYPAPSRARLHERELPVAPRAQSVDPWNRVPDCEPVYPEARPLRLVERSTTCEPSRGYVARTPAPYAPRSTGYTGYTDAAPCEPTVVVRAPAPRAPRVVVTPPAPPRVVITTPRAPYVVRRAPAPTPPPVYTRAPAPPVYTRTPYRSDSYYDRGSYDRGSYDRGSYGRGSYGRGYDRNPPRVLVVPPAPPRVVFRSPEPRIVVTPPRPHAGVGVSVGRGGVRVGVRFGF